MECLFQELKMELFIKELSEDNHLNMELVVKLIEQLVLLIELDIQCYILFLEEHWVITAFSLLNISFLI